MPTLFYLTKQNYYKYYLFDPTLPGCFKKLDQCFILRTLSSHITAILFQHITNGKNTWQSAPAPSPQQPCTPSLACRWQCCQMGEGVRCSSVVRAFAHGAMGRRIDPSWRGPIELFLVPASIPRLVFQRPWYVLSCLWDCVYKRSLPSSLPSSGKVYSTVLDLAVHGPGAAGRTSTTASVAGGPSLGEALLPWKEGRKEMFYLTTHSTHFIYGYMTSDIW